MEPYEREENHNKISIIVPSEIIRDTVIKKITATELHNYIPVSIFDRVFFRKASILVLKWLINLLLLLLFYVNSAICQMCCQ